MQAIPLVVLRSQKEQNELVEFTKKITEYTMAMRIELERKRLASSVQLVQALLNYRETRVKKLRSEWLSLVAT